MAESDSPISIAAAERRALAVARGICRLFARNDIWCLPEMPLRSGRRADLMGIDARGHLVIVEIKVSRADLLGDLRLPDKRDSYLDLGGQCWYVLGCDARGRPIAQADEIPPDCGVLLAPPDAPLEVLRHAPQRVVPDLPFALWMALAKATPLPGTFGDDEPGQALLHAPPPEAA